MFLGKILIFYQQGNVRLLLFGLFNFQSAVEVSSTQTSAACDHFAATFLKYPPGAGGQSHKRRSLFTEALIQSGSDYMGRVVVVAVTGQNQLVSVVKVK